MAFWNKKSFEAQPSEEEQRLAKITALKQRREDLLAQISSPRHPGDQELL
jgi:hypothetical protein